MHHGIIFAWFVRDSTIRFSNKQIVIVKLWIKRSSIVDPDDYCVAEKSNKHTYWK